MKYVPKSLSRLASRSMLKLNANSPTILVVAGVVGLGATAVMAAKATRKIDPVLARHQSGRKNIKNTATDQRDEQKKLVVLYSDTALDFLKVYGPTIAVGTLSAGSVLLGHRILKGRHVATMLAYSGLQDQFLAYRKRVAKTLGEQAERDIYDGAHGEYVEDPDHKGEYKMQPVFDDKTQSYLRPWFDEANVNWTKDAYFNYLFLKGVQGHMNNLLQTRGHVFLNDVLDALGMERCREAAVLGWILGGEGDDFVDFGFMTGQDPHTVAFRNQAERTVRLNFNVDGLIWDKI